MKFAFATAFILALAMGVQSSIIPWGGPGLSVISPVHGHLLAQPPAAITIAESPVWHGGWLGGHGAVAIAGPGLLPHGHLDLIH